MHLIVPGVRKTIIILIHYYCAVIQVTEPVASTTGASVAGAAQYAAYIATGPCQSCVEITFNGFKTENKYL